MKNLVAELVENVEVFGVETLRGYVAQSILDNAHTNNVDDVSSFMDDVMRYGCVSGTVTDMIYYVDTLAFFDKYVDFIEDILNEYDLLEDGAELDKFITLKYVTDEDDIQELEEMYDFNVTGEKNRYAWMAYELMLSSFCSEYEELLAI
jgi:hypothetical protein